MRRIRITSVSIAALVTGGILYGAYQFFWGRPTPIFDLPGAGGAPAFTTEDAVARQAPAGYKEYRDSRLGISLFYPQELGINEMDVAGSITLTFQSIKPVEGFQIYMTPYPLEQVTEAQFKLDEPSGIRKDPKFGLINGASAAAFYGYDKRLGDTYEVWIVRGWRLYEVTTLKPLDTWLQNILQTWLFTQ